ncbi:TPA: hypothetical protein ACGVAS_004331 [Vibrio vulnificus]
MAITIRDTKEHEQMLSKLKQQTGETTLSKALLKGGYEAIRYRDLCASQQEQIDELRSKLYDKSRAICGFLDSLDKLRSFDD